MATPTQPKISYSLKPSNLTSKTFFKTTNCNIHSSSSTLCLNTVQNFSKLKLSASAADSIVSQEESPTHKQKLGVVVKPMEKPRIVLKLIWMEKAIGVALDQVIPGFGSIPLSPYYFWPNEDAWEQLKVLLESKPWISRKQMHLLLNQATDIINLWQGSGSNSL
ncbi:30S ribosomal protein 3, chloroplastic-like [Mercurialis annua]|uniref:30S ribosomal protein 3, chloroplastic-like n=1 Tax=Mercurialis annua TaxID=3986 RepID=UPI0021607618|nr:30S ribosomal protein 3, chloroplastic-like [Mercurialis annua]